MVDGPRRQLPPIRLPLSLPVIRQSADNTCVPACLEMLLDAYAPDRRKRLIENYELSSLGMLPADVIAFALDNLEAVGRQLRRGTLDQALSSGEPFMVVVHADSGGHAVVVDGAEDVDGVEYLRVRDPAEGSYLERRDALEMFRMVDDEHITWPALWGVNDE